MADRSCDTTHHRRRNKREKFRKCWKCWRQGLLSKHKCCLAKKEKCRKCGCIGHFHSVCRSRNSKQTKVFATNFTPEEEPEGKVTFGGQEVHMLIDFIQCNWLSTVEATQIKWNPFAEANQKQVTNVLCNTQQSRSWNKILVDDWAWRQVCNRCWNPNDHKGRPLLGRKAAKRLGVQEIKLPES